MITTLHATTAIAFLIQATAAIVPPRTIEVPQWSTYEMTGANLVLAAQEFPNPYRTNAVAGIVRKTDAAAGKVVVRAADGVDHVVHITQDTAVHGKAAAVDVFDGLEEGSHVIVHYAMTDGEETAMEVDRVGKDGLEMMEARVTHLDRAKQELKVTLADGSRATLRLTHHAAAEAGDAANEATSVMLYYTNEAGERVVHSSNASADWNRYRTPA
jgi:hypothetical protein